MTAHEFLKSRGIDPTWNIFTSGGWVPLTELLNAFKKIKPSKCVKIDEGQWLCCGNIIQHQSHPKLQYRYVVFNATEAEKHVGCAHTLKEAKALCELNPYNTKKLRISTEHIW